MAQPRDIYDQLASRLREMVAEEHVNSLSGVERFTVQRATPLLLEHTDGDLVLEEGDPDFTIGVTVRAYLTSHGVVVGDQVWCLRENQEWHLVDITDPA